MGDSDLLKPYPMKKKKKKRTKVKMFEEICKNHNSFSLFLNVAEQTSQI